MPSCSCPPPVDFDPIFGERAAAKDLDSYRREGPQGSTRTLVAALVAEGVKGSRVIDVGAGVGAVGFELLAAGADRFTDVDAARAYVAAVREEAERRGLSDRVTVLHGDFTQLAEGLPTADIVALDRVVCCYGNWRALLDAATARSRRLIGLVYPVDRWWLRLGIKAVNLGLRLSRHSYRGYIHRTDAIDGRLRAAGFFRAFHRRGLIWQTYVYRRA